MPVVIDTSVWVDFLRGSETAHVQALEMVVRRGDAVLGDLIVTEVLQGVVNQRQFRALRRHFSEFPIYTMVGPELAIRSATYYRQLRNKGFTIRKTIDCWIATFCIERGFELLHNDRDFDLFQRYLDLRVYAP